MPDNTDKDVALNAAIDAYYENSYGQADGGELSRQRALAIDADQGKIIDVAPEGRSQVTDRTVFETKQWIMPSMMRIFAGGDNIVEFDPTGPEDEDAAAQESDILNYQITQKNDWDLVVRTWCEDALTTKNAYCMPFMEEKLTTEIEHYEGQSEEQLALLLEDDVEVVGQKQYDNPDDEGQLIDPTTGQPVQDEAEAIGALAIYQAAGQEPQMQFEQLYDVDIRSTKARQQLQFKVLPPERCRVGEDTTDFTLGDCNYFEYDELVTLSELRADGFDVDDDIASDDMPSSEESESRDETYSSDQENDLPDKAMRQVRVRNIWIRHDYDEDGIAELQRVVRVGDEILLREHASRIPVACIVPFINTHRHIGTSVADLVFDIQRIKTSLLRSGIDSLNLANHPRHAISDKVNLDDMLISRPGSLVRLKNGAVPGEGHVMPLPTENTFPYAREGLLHMDQVVESRVGVNRMFQGIDASNTNDHDRVGQLSTMAAQRVEDIARIFGTGFKRLFSLAHEILIKSGGKSQSIKLRGEWVDFNPSQWRTGRDMRVTAPFAAGNKDSLVQRLMVHMGVHEKALAAGLPIVDASDAYELALMLSQATDIPGNKIYTDPKTVQPKEPGPDHTMIALEIESKKVENAAKDSELDAEVKLAQVASDAEVKTAVAQLNSDTQIALAQIKEGQQVNLEQLKARLKDAPTELGKAFDHTSKIAEELSDAVKRVNEAMDELDRKAKAPIKIVRENGKVVGKEVDGVFVPLEE